MIKVGERYLYTNGSRRFVMELHLWNEGYRGRVIWANSFDLDQIGNIRSGESIETYPKMWKQLKGQEAP